MLTDRLSVTEAAVLLQRRRACSELQIQMGSNHRGVVEALVPCTQSPGTWVIRPFRVCRLLREPGGMAAANDPNVDRQGLQVLDEETCWRLVDSVDVGRIGFTFENRPLVLPVNHRVADHSVVFRTAEGSKLEIAIARRRVVFEVDGWSSDHRAGWSVLVHGVAMPVTSGPRYDALADLELEPWASESGRVHWIRVRPDEVTGRATPPKSDE
jgi:nitroimidazol reductase NimA-like FMN-containing flavoprotein (pyridoxamine 5'-phosphate oxidase superfamily)